MKSFLPINLVCTALAVAALFAGCSKKPAADVLARVGDREITVADFKAEYERRQANRQPLPDRQALLDQMIDRETFLQQARAAGLDKSADVRRACEDILLDKFKAAQLEPKVAALKVTTEEVQATYDKDITHFTQPAKAKLAFIFIPVVAKADTNKLALAEARANQARQLATALPLTARGFGQVAADFSDDQVTRYRGGDAGWFTMDAIEDRWPATVIAAGFALKNAGDVSDVLRSKDGFYLVKKLDVRAVAVTPMEQVRPAIERRLLLAKHQETEQQFQSQSRQAVTVTTDAALLAATAYPNPTLGKTAQAQMPAVPNTP
ncbi:MAG TPA: peptidylprolyl isomerase [Verrucomicrobiae bacterium]|nr:peptidylprolyl isomerase [Verrucomicrobiae bacterium]